LRMCLMRSSLPGGELGDVFRTGGAGAPPVGQLIKLLLFGFNNYPIGKN
jgi:hypothetical protein